MLPVDVARIRKIAEEAGEQIMQIYRKDFEVIEKDDRSPLTAADQASHAVIKQGLSRLYPEIPVLSEEGEDIAYEERQAWSMFWLVDPLDGTKEFIKRNGEFTVNIALVEEGFPILGVIYVPVTKTMYVGSRQEGAYKVDAEGIQEQISCHQLSIHLRTSAKAEERGEEAIGDNLLSRELTLVESRSHPSPELEALMAKLSKYYTNIQRIQKGSSLKLCAVAEGVADLYPRLGPTMEWDTAAGQAIIEAAGGEVLTLSGERFRYNKESLRNEYFLAIGNGGLKELLFD